MSINISAVEAISKSPTSRSVLSSHPRRVFSPARSSCLRPKSCAILVQPPTSWITVLCQFSKQCTEMQSKYLKRLQADFWTGVLICSKTAVAVLRFVPAWWIPDVYFLPPNYIVFLCDLNVFWSSPFSTCLRMRYSTLPFNTIQGQ